MFVPFASQSTGTLGITNFFILIFIELGMTGYMPLLMYCVFIVEATAFNYLGTFFLDKIGRRTMLRKFSAVSGLVLRLRLTKLSTVIGFPGCAACLLAEALLQMKYTGTGNKAGLGACVFFIFLFFAFFGFAIDPVQYVFASEIFPTTIRAKGIGLALFSYFVGAITYTTPGALAFRNIGWKYYMVWFAVTICSSVITYFYIPETTGLSLEEIGTLFGDEVVVHMTADGHGLVEMDDFNKGHIPVLWNPHQEEEEKRGSLVKREETAFPSEEVTAAP